MQITKYEHACVVVEEEGSRLVIDPGAFSDSLGAVQNVVAIVITHVHDDHINADKLQQLLKDSPEAQIFSTQQTKDKYSDLPITAVMPNESMMVGPFHLSFCGGKHAVIHPSRPQDENVGVVVNNNLYYPGDSFATPPEAVEVLLAPAAAPWLKIGEAMDFITAVQAPLNIPTHDAILSQIGQDMTDMMLSHVAEQAGLRYKRLATGESIEM